MHKKCARYAHTHAATQHTRRKHTTHTTTNPRTRTPRAHTVVIQHTKPEARLVPNTHSRVAPHTHTRAHYHTHKMHMLCTCICTSSPQVHPHTQSAENPGHSCTLYSTHSLSDHHNTHPHRWHTYMHTYTQQDQDTVEGRCRNR